MTYIEHLNYVAVKTGQAKLDIVESMQSEHYPVSRHVEIRYQIMLRTIQEFIEGVEQERDIVTKAQASIENKTENKEM